MTIKLVHDNWQEDLSASFEIVCLGMCVAFALGFAFARWFF